jgi:hypothetical protein
MTAMDSAVSTLANIELIDSDKNRVRLGDLWRDQPAVLVWLRHYG